jgi:hypothetical protein
VFISPKQTVAMHMTTDSLIFLTRPDKSGSKK